MTLPGMQRDAETERVRTIYDRLALSRHESSDDAWPFGGTARWLCGHANGETLEVGIGRGRTLPLYSPGTRLTGIELSSVAVAKARSRAAALGMDARLLQGDAQALPFAEASFDTVLFSFVLCTVPDDARAVAEAVRVLKPGGRLAFVEHVRSPNLVVRSIERLLEPLFLRQMRDHLLREPLHLVQAAGLGVETLERQGFGLVERLVARKPPAAVAASEGSPVASASEL